MKSFECMVLPHLRTITDPLLDPLQLTSRANRSVDDAVNRTWPSSTSSSIWNPLEPMPGSCLFCFQHHHPSSATGKALPAEHARLHLQLDHRLPVWEEGAREAGITCLWLTDHQHWIPPKLVFLLLCSTPSCTFSHQSVNLLKFTDDTTVIGFISDGDQ